jgi:hypothetical protein
MHRNRGVVSIWGEGGGTDRGHVRKRDRVHPSGGIDVSHERIQVLVTGARVDNPLTTTGDELMKLRARPVPSGAQVFGVPEQFVVPAASSAYNLPTPPPTHTIPPLTGTRSQRTCPECNALHPGRTYCAACSEGGRDNESHLASTARRRRRNARQRVVTPRESSSSEANDSVEPA